VKVIDSNLYELDSGVRIKLAGLECPSVNHPNSALREIGIKMMRYAKDTFPGRPLIIEHAFYDSESEEQYVFIYRDYPFYKEFYNEKLLSRGFGRHTDVEDTFINTQLKLAEEDAKKKKIGIWKNDLTGIADMKAVTDAPVIKDKEITFGGVFFEIIGGAAIGIAGGVITGMALVYLTGPHFGEWGGFGYGLFGFYTGYVVSSSSVVYGVGKGHNPSINYGLCMLSSFAGASAAVGLLAANQYNQLFSQLSFISALALPLAGSVLYVNLADGPAVPREHSFKDIVRQNSSYMEVLRVRF
jgi:hypothetical protein